MLAMLFPWCRTVLPIHRASSPLLQINHIDSTDCITDATDSLTATSDGNGPFQQDNVPCHDAKTVHDKEFMVLMWLLNTTNLNPTEHLWDLMLTTYCLIPQESSRDLLVSMLRWIRAVFVA